jgi:2-hydroxy-6-oxonona-2,4-dienedioate hydrolase
MELLTSDVRLPVDRQYVDILGLRTAFYRSESGDEGLENRKTVVLIHGGAPGVSSELNWFKNFQSLMDAGYNVVAYDQPGFGYTEAPNDHSIDFRLKHLIVFLNALAIDEVNLIGNSIGGLLCTLYALRAPPGPRVLSLVLAAPFPYFEPPLAVQERLLAHRSRLSSIEPTFESIRNLCLNTFNQSSCVSDEVVRLRLSMLQGDRWEAYKARSGMSREFDREGVDGQNIGTSTLLVWGVEDRSLPYEIGIEAMNRFTRGRFLFLTQSGHWPQTEQADAFNQAMVAFLDSVRNRGA